MQFISAYTSEVNKKLLIKKKNKGTFIVFLQRHLLKYIITSLGILKIALIQTTKIYYKQLPITLIRSFLNLLGFKTYVVLVWDSNDLLHRSTPQWDWWKLFLKTTI